MTGTHRRIVIAPDSFKGSLSAAEAARVMAAGWSSVRDGDEIVLRPMADGGEGTLDAFLAAHDAEPRTTRVAGADGRDRDAPWALLSDGTAIIELGVCCGIEQLGSARAPFTAHTAGFGQAIAAALDAGAERLVLGIGSSASTDGGAGMLGALGARLLDAGGREVAPSPDGLASLASVDLSALRAAPAGGVLVLSDVTNPLAGPAGAAAVFGPQKGIPAERIGEVDDVLSRWAQLLIAAAGTDDDLVAAPGSGAAGGTGFALRVWGADLVPGAAAVADLIGLAAASAAADVVITGEGSYDAQSAAGKVPAHVASLSSAATVLIAGRITPDADTSAFAVALSLTELAGSSEASLTDPRRWLHEAAASAAARV